MTVSTTAFLEAGYTARRSAGVSSPNHSLFTFCKTNFVRTPDKCEWDKMHNIGISGLLRAGALVTAEANALVFLLVAWDIWLATKSDPFEILLESSPDVTLDTSFNCGFELRDRKEPCNKHRSLQDQTSALLCFPKVRDSEIDLLVPDGSVFFGQR
jgi:hypothetical protein